jgi:hypothetical protein
MPREPARHQSAESAESARPQGTRTTSPRHIASGGGPASGVDRRVVIEGSIVAADPVHDSDPATRATTPEPRRRSADELPEPYLEPLSDPDPEPESVADTVTVLTGAGLRATDPQAQTGDTDGAGGSSRADGDVSAQVEGFQPANSVEENLLDAARQRRTDRFLSTLLLARVLVPGWSDNDVPDADEWAVARSPAPGTSSRTPRPSG